MAEAGGTFQTLVTAERQPRQNFHTLLSCVLPRPIAWVSTISASGVPNLAPFSFFNGVGSNPPAVMFSPCNRADGSVKDTVRNLREVGEFVVHVVPYGLREAMNDTSYTFGPEEDEIALCGLTPLPSRFVRPPRIAESPVHMECRLVQIVEVGGGPLSANVCIGEVLCFHIARNVLQADGTADLDRLDLIGRCGGDVYVTVRDRFVLPKPQQRPLR